ncbi:MAG: Txe/YoeB family addiction module toxin [Beijerinckiaceae bacterium]|nr:Txe/YoeB family addiction module toxin [Beijerinckiaceae bacterium]
MRLLFSPRAWDDYLYWQQHDPAILGRINDLVRAASRTPFAGIGRPEPLFGNMKGWWSRRITREHRLVYRVSGSGEDQALEIAKCRFHYRG